MWYNVGNHTLEELYLVNLHLEIEMIWICNFHRQKNSDKDDQLRGNPVNIYITQQICSVADGSKKLEQLWTFLMYLSRF